MNPASILLLVACVVLAGAAEWVAKTPIPTRRSDMSCTTWGNGIYLLGGCSSDQVYYSNNSACGDINDRADVYYPETDTWAPLPAMPRERQRHVTVAYNGKLYLFGGRDVNDTLIQQVDVFDVAAKTWSTLSTLFTQPTSDHAGFLIGDKILLVGGYNQDYTHSDRTHYFIPATQTFQYQVATLNKGRGDICAAEVNGNGYIFGGFQDTDFCHEVDFLEEFLTTPSASWALEPAAHDVDGGDGACASYNGLFYSIGGETKDANCLSQPLTIVETFDPVARTWTTQTSMALPQARFRFCSVVYDNVIHIFGGQGPLERKGSEYTHPIVAENLVYDFGAASALVPSFLFLAAIALLALII